MNEITIGQLLRVVGAIYVAWLIYVIARVLRER
jgi:hypothetical protein